MKHVVKVGESLYAISSKYGLTVSELRQLNPLVSSSLRIGQELTVQKPVVTPSQTDTISVSITSTPLWHTVKAGDTLFGVAQRYKLTITDLIAANQLPNNQLSLGQRLKIEKYIAPPPPKEVVVVTIPDTYTVGKGDSWYVIAKRYNLSVDNLKLWNKAANDLLREGQKIVLKPTNTQPNKEEISSDLPVDVLTQMRRITEARKTFVLTTNNGIDIFGEGLRSAVGINHINRPEDLTKVQIRLVQLGILPATHEEESETLYKRYGRGAITANLIPKTIDAIELFQKKFNVMFWIEHSTRVAMMRTNSFTQGVIMPNDVTYRVLCEYTEYKLSFSHPQDGSLTSVKFYNFPASSHTQYYQGVSYAGKSNPEIPLSVFQRLGVNAELAEALRYVSRNEGNFDAINTYDKAIFSYGFIQFAGNGGGLPMLLAHIKNKSPRLFQDFFETYGINVDYVLHQGAVQSPKIQVANPYDKGGKYWLEGLEAEMALRENKQLYGVFIRAGYHLPLITLQIDAAIRNYVLPALRIKLDVRFGTTQISNILITQLISSPLGLAILMDMVINRWIGQTKDIFKQAFENLIVSQKIQNFETLQRIDERKIVEQLITDAKIRNDLRLVQRATTILQGTLSSQKTATSLLT